jgi:outer membrane lipoprotein carrier protein
MDSEKCWRHRLRETISHTLGFTRAFAAGLTLVAGVSLWSAAVSAQAADADTTADTLAEADSIADASALDAFIENVHSFTASFEQEVWTADQELLETSTGHLSLRRPDRFRLSYDTPYESLVVADGRTLWMYEVDLEQVTRAPLDDGLSQAPAMLLSGDEGISDNFDVAQTYRLADRDWVKLTPKQPGGDYSSVLIGFADGFPAELEVVDGLRQTTRIVFADVELNPELDDVEFEFVPPPGVDVIGGD